jgi:hypothetical protein
VHLREDLMKTMKKGKLKIVLVPAKLTWLLQPLDTHVFQLYKKQLRKLYAELRQQSDNGMINASSWWHVLAAHANEFLESRSWAYTFEANGWCLGTREISPYLKAQLQWDTLPVMEASLPSEEELLTVLPHGRGKVARAVLQTCSSGLPSRAETAVAGPPPAQATLASSSSGATARWPMPRATRLLSSLQSRC